MPVVLKTVGKLLGGTLLKIGTSLLTEKMVEWAFWWLAEKLVESTDETWDDDLLRKMWEAREESKRGKE